MLVLSLLGTRMVNTWLRNAHSSNLHIFYFSLFHSSQKHRFTRNCGVMMVRAAGVGSGASKFSTG